MPTIRCGRVVVSTGPWILRVGRIRRWWWSRRWWWRAGPRGLAPRLVSHAFRMPDSPDYCAGLVAPGVTVGTPFAAAAQGSLLAFRPPGPLRPLARQPQAPRAPTLRPRPRPRRPQAPREPRAAALRFRPLALRAQFRRHLARQPRALRSGAPQPQARRPRPQPQPLQTLQ